VRDLGGKDGGVGTQKGNSMGVRGGGRWVGWSFTQINSLIEKEKKMGGASIRIKNSSNSDTAPTCEQEGSGGGREVSGGGRGKKISQKKGNGVMTPSSENRQKVRKRKKERIRRERNAKGQAGVSLAPEHLLGDWKSQCEKREKQMSL